MAVTVNSCRIQSNITSRMTNSTGATYSLSKKIDDTLQSAGSFTFDRVFSLDSYSLTLASGNLDIDLYDLASLNIGTVAGADNLGLPHTNSLIHYILIKNDSTSAGNLRIDNGVTNAWTGLLPASATLDLSPGMYVSCMFGTTGKAVTDASSHMLRLSAQTDDCTIDVTFFAS